MAPRFEIDEPGSDDANSPVALNQSESIDSTTPSHPPGMELPDSQLPSQGESRLEPGLSPQTDLILSGSGSSWRNEVAYRVSRYRARRRPSVPRYPSLTLKFETPEAKSRFDVPDAPTEHALAIDNSSVIEEGPALPEPGKLIEFPRPLMLPPRPLDELAEPVLDRPRILEVPEVSPPPPALGGILIEPSEAKPEEKRPGFEIPLQAASMSRRVAAAAIDAILVLAASALFDYVFFRIAKTVPPLPTSAEMALVLIASLWTIYQFLLLFFTGSTPGLRVAKLQLSRFDGDPVPRRLRRWRLLASALSAVSLGLGYAWCFLDEDQLCWHDRITRTYIAPRKS